MLEKDRERLVKLLKMTHSSNDSEALVAIRKCNDILIQHKLSWHDVVTERCSSHARGMPHGAANRVAEATRTVRTSSSRAFEASIKREKYLEQVRRNEESAAFQAYVRKVPMPLRLTFFPLWAAAAMLAGFVIPEVSAPMRALKWFGALLVVATCGVAWLQMFNVAVAFL